MSDPRLRALAELVTGYSVDVGEGDLVLIQGSVLTEPLMVELVRSVLERGGVPRVRGVLDGVDRAYLMEAGEQQLSHLPAHVLEEMDAIDVRLSIHAAWNTRELSTVDPVKIAKRQAAAAPAMARFMQRSAAGDLRWCVTAYPCEAFAQDADMSTDAYADFVYRAGWLDLPDPVAAWRAYADRLEQLVERLRGVRRLRVLGEDTDLTVGVVGRTWIPSSGHHNFPDGEVFTGPVETETDGHVRFSFPAVSAGREVADVRLRFEGGRVVESDAATGAEYLRQMIGMDGGSVLGEFAIGTNYAVDRFTKQILFDEKIGGSCHMALGAGYPETGSVNVSGLHWDMVCDLRDGGEIHADGEPIYRAGEFLPSFFEPSLKPA
ncbi:MAG TPA: aminopeptidase [Gaiellales bacterium]|nr:aminopeptidase [Gaiellales bacterium]